MSSEGVPCRGLQPSLARRRTYGEEMLGLRAGRERGGRILTSFKGVLVVCTRIVRDLDTRPPLTRILEEVDVGGLVEPVVRRFLRRRCIVVVDVAVPAAPLSAPGSRVEELFPWDVQGGYVLLAGLRRHGR